MKYYVGTQEDTFRDNSSKAKSNFMLAFYGSQGSLLFIYEDNDDLAGVIDATIPIERFRHELMDLKAMRQFVTSLKQEVDKVIKLPKDKE